MICRGFSLPRRCLSLLVPLALGFVVGCQDGPSDADALAPASAHDQAVAVIQNLGVHMDVGQTTLGKNGVKLDFRGTRVTDETLGHLEALNPVLELYLDNTGITDAGVAHLAALDDLHTLRLNGTAVSDIGLKSLTGLANLEVLTLQDTKVTPGGVEALQKALPKTRILH